MFFIFVYLNCLETNKKISNFENFLIFEIKQF